MTEPPKPLHQLVVRVSRAQASELPEGTSQAVAPCFVFADDYGDALRQAVTELARRRLVAEEFAPTFVAIPLDRWQAHVEVNFPEVAHLFPTEAQVREMAKTGTVFFGPFSGFEPPRPADAP